MKKTLPTRRQSVALAEQRDRGQRIRGWFDDLERALAKRREARRAKRQATPATSRGVDRVPDRLRGLTITTEPHLFGKRDADQTRPLAQPGDVHSAGNYETRRARGERGHARKPRRRELPGAVARRTERNRKAWLS